MPEPSGRRGAGSPRLVLSNATLILPDHIVEGGSLVLEDGRITEIASRPLPVDPLAGDVDCDGRLLLPGFIDVHVHGVEGADTLEGGDAVERIAARLPRYGVTAFCPTSIACDPATLATLLDAVARAGGAPSGARVLPAHLESNFIAPAYCGAQPVECLRLPYATVEGDYSGPQLLDIIRAARSSVGIVTLAPEIDRGCELIADLVTQGIHVSLGHSGATYEQALQGFDAGASQATHLFNRMAPLSHRAPGLAGAALERGDVSAEIICDGVHVHPSVARLAFAAKGPGGLMAITDGTAGSGLPRGTKATLGGRTITVGDAAHLDDGTLAGSVLTMDRAFASLRRDIGLGLVEASRSCSGTPAAALHLKETGAIRTGYAADVLLMDHRHRVQATYIAGSLAWRQA